MMLRYYASLGIMFMQLLANYKSNFIDISNAKELKVFFTADIKISSEIGSD